MTDNAVPTPDEIWKILRETAASQKEADARYAAFREEDDARRVAFLKEQEESSRKASQEIKEIRALHREIAKQQKKNEALFNSQWGHLMESLVEGDLIPILNQWGIPVENTSTNVKKRSRDENYEYDIIAENGREVVVVEVKTTLRVSDVDKFLVDLGQFTTRKPRYRDNTIYGAMAWLRVVQEAEIYAQRRGLFVIRATGSSASIVNGEGFKPRIFA